MKKHLFLLPCLKTARELSALLENSGIDHNRIHVAHEDHARAMKYHLNDLNFLEETDTIHSDERGFMIGVVLAAVVGFFTYRLLEGHPAGGIGTVFACLFALGFPIWLGGMIGASSDNYRLQPYHEHIQQGGAVVMVDINNPLESEKLNETIKNYTPARAAGTTSGFDNPFAGQLIPRKHLS